MELSSELSKSKILGTLGAEYYFIGIMVTELFFGVENLQSLVHGQSCDVDK